MSIVKQEQTIWFPGIYGGRTEPEWIEIASHINLEELIKRVQTRAKEDGEWAIANGFVGDNEDKMRRMMAFVSDEKNIRQCLEHIHTDGLDHQRTVDWVCRELANASKWMVR